MLKLLLALLFVLPAEPPIAPEPARYQEGQVWEYRTRPGEESSLLKIQRIETSPEGRDPIYHISVIGVRLGGRDALVEMQHLPVSPATLDASVTRMSDSHAAFPSADEGIAMWREGRGGVFDVPVAEIVGIADAALRSEPAPEPAPAT